MNTTNNANNANNATNSSSIDSKLLQLLVCPITKGPLEFDRRAQELVSRSARLAYPVRDGMPVMLESEARVLTDAELGL